MKFDLLTPTRDVFYIISLSLIWYKDTAINLKILLSPFCCRVILQIGLFPYDRVNWRRCSSSPCTIIPVKNPESGFFILKRTYLTKPANLNCRFPEFFPGVCHFPSETGRKLKQYFQASPLNWSHIKDDWQLL